MTALAKVAAGLFSRDEPAVPPLPELFKVPPGHPHGLDLQHLINAAEEELEREESLYTADRAGLRADGIIGRHERKLAGLRDRLRLLRKLRDDRARAAAHPQSFQRRWDNATNAALQRVKYLAALELLGEPTEQALENPNTSADVLRQRYVDELENIEFGSSPERLRPRLVAEARERLARLEQRIRARESSPPDA
jgi:hypothetical protein